jgi:hypothetical protein
LYLAADFGTVAPMLQPTPRVDRWEAIIAAAVSIVGLILIAASFLAGR